LFIKLEICIQNRKSNGTINSIAVASTFLAMLSTDWSGDEFLHSVCRTASKEMSGTMQEAAAACPSLPQRAPTRTGNSRKPQAH
jgi:hypothetical protein